ncbi:hypothetical protein PCANC_25189 [Puccinia coronata f. sp. avenae]|uniref:Uncharacterized protein n=1 Tax=Puccinia coronata f. sp. avenae TaxID=200324 RepID=A0A2N5TTJ7_9BASI|nr:hypothetical protein PCANC_25189 [Puccinia coronata f. sp. avenae]
MPPPPPHSGAQANQTVYWTPGWPEPSCTTPNGTVYTPAPRGTELPAPPSGATIPSGDGLLLCSGAPRPPAISSFHPRNQGYSGPPQHRGNHPYRQPFQRNWQRLPDPISSMMEMGNFLMRAEQVMGCMQRLRNRGGRGYRASNRGNNQFHHPLNFPQ